MEAEFLTIVGTVIGAFVASMAITVTMFINLGTKVDGFQAEMRDLHGRISKIEARLLK
jgi:hypothetical protein